MKLRIARKLDPMRRRPSDGREWWKVYSIAQLARAEVRLRKRWSRLHVVTESGRDVSEDWFAANRIRTQRSRQIAIRRTTSMVTKLTSPHGVWTDVRKL